MADTQLLPRVRFWQRITPVLDQEIPIDAQWGFRIGPLIVQVTGMNPHSRTNDSQLTISKPNGGYP